MGLTAKNAPRNALPCMRSCRSARSVALRAISKPGSVKTRIFFSMICWRAQMGRFCHARSPSTIRLPNQAAAFLHAVERIGVRERLGIAAENDGHVAQIAVDANAILGRDHEVAGGRALLLRTVLGIGADVNDFLGIAQIVLQSVALEEQIVQVAENRAQILAGGDRAPSADGVEAHGHRAFGQQRRRFIGDDRVGMVDAENDEVHAVGCGLAVFARAARGGEFKGANDVLGAEVARAQAVAAADEARNFGECRP